MLQVGRIEQAARPAAQPVGGRRWSRSRSPAGTASPATWLPSPTTSRCTSCPPASGAAPRWNSREALRYRDVSAVGRRIDGAYRASAAYLEHGRPMPLMAPKPLPPRWVRRVVLAPAMVGVTVALLVTLPVWLLRRGRGVAAAARAGCGPLRVLWVGSSALVLESASPDRRCSGCGSPPGSAALVRTPPFQRVHYRARRLVPAGACTARRRGCSGCGWRSRARPRTSTSAGRCWCSAGTPGPGDSFLLIHALVNWYAREPRIVLAAALQWDPAIDVVLNRLPNRFLVRPAVDDGRAADRRHWRPRSTATTPS